MGGNLSDRQARSDPAANSQKDKNSEQFPHNRLRSDGSQPCQGCRMLLLYFRLISAIVSFVSTAFGSGSRIKARRNFSHSSRDLIPCDGSLIMSDVRGPTLSLVREGAPRPRLWLCDVVRS
jgi:hypothetical protein